MRVGYVLPLWRSASGRVFLAYLPERDTAALLQEEEPKLGRAEVAAEIARIRAAGFARCADDVEFTGIAAPVLDHDGVVVAALTLSRPYDENTHARRLALGSGRARRGRRHLKATRPCARNGREARYREGLVSQAGKN